MSADPALNGLRRLVELRKHEAERLAADVSSKRAVRDRYAASLARLEELYHSSGPSGAQPGPVGKGLCPALSLNCGGYKQVVMQMVATHRADLAVHQAEVATAERRAVDALRRREALGAELTRRLAAAERVRTRREQKRQDEIAGQVWAAQGAGRPR